MRREFGPDGETQYKDFYEFNSVIMRRGVE